jgi:hypothetical protein
MRVNQPGFTDAVQFYLDTLEAGGEAVNWGLGLIGIDPVAWNTDHPGLTIVCTLNWQYTPLMMLILLVGLQSQSAEVLEAADVDGASSLQTFQYMTPPHLRTYAELAILLGTVFMIQVFDPVNIMTKGAGNTKTIAYLLYERAFTSPPTASPGPWQCPTRTVARWSCSRPAPSAPNAWSATPLPWTTTTRRWRCSVRAPAASCRSDRRAPNR